MAAELPHYEILAVRYGTSSARPASQNFIMADGHDGPMPMDFYIWVIRGEGRTIVVDTGFSAGASERRNRRFVHRPAEALAQAGVDPAAVQDVVITHLHWDHSGNMDLFPNATFHIQDAEMAQATGRCICHKWFRRQSEVDDVVALVKNLYAGRVKFHDGEGTVAPGVTVHLSAAIPAACRSCASTPRVAPWCWQATRCTTGKISPSRIRFRRPTSWTRSKRSASSKTWPRTATTSFPATIPWCSAASRRCAAISISCGWI